METLDNILIGCVVVTYFATLACAVYQMHKFSKEANAYLAETQTDPLEEVGWNIPSSGGISYSDMDSTFKDNKE